MHISMVFALLLWGVCEQPALRYEPHATGLESLEEGRDGSRPPVPCPPKQEAEAGSPDAGGTLTKETLRRCTLSPVPSPSKAPWYFHYERGLKLAQRGKPQRALGALLAAIDREPEPKRLARIYGMWHIDYLPYFNAARMYAELGNWVCARESLRISQAKGEISVGDEEYEAFLRLRSKLQRHWY